MIYMACRIKSLDEMSPDIDDDKKNVSEMLTFFSFQLIHLLRHHQEHALL